MGRILRGDIYWADLNPAKGREQAGHRPVLIISHEVFNEKSGTVIAFAITSKEPKAGLPFSYEIPGHILEKPSWVKINQIRTLSIERMEKKAGRLTETDMETIIEGLLDIIG